MEKVMQEPEDNTNQSRQLEQPVFTLANLLTLVESLIAGFASINGWNVDLHLSADSANGISLKMSPPR